MPEVRAGNADGRGAIHSEQPSGAVSLCDLRLADGEKPGRFLAGLSPGRQAVVGCVFREVA